MKDYRKAFNCVNYVKLWFVLGKKESQAIPLCRNLYTGEEKTTKQSRSSSSDKTANTVINYSIYIMNKY